MVSQINPRIMSNRFLRFFTCALVLTSTFCIFGCFHKPTPVDLALRGDVGGLMRLKANDVSLDSQDPNHANWTPLMAAIYSQNTNVTTYLLQQHVDLLKRARAGE